MKVHPGHLRAVQVPRGLTSWGILNRPYGTVPSSHSYPGLRPGLFSAVPSGLFIPLISTQDCVLGHSQPSLRDCSFLSFLPRTNVLGILSRSYGTVPSSHFYPGLRPGLFSAVPSGTVPSSHFYSGLRPGAFSAVPTGLFLLLISTQDCVLGYSQPSLPELFLPLISTQDCVLGYSQPSLRDCSFFSFLPRTASWAILSRPFGTDLIPPDCDRSRKSLCRSSTRGQTGSRVRLSLGKAA